MGGETVNLNHLDVLQPSAARSLSCCHRDGSKQRKGPFCNSTSPSPLSAGSEELVRQDF